MSKLVKVDFDGKEFAVNVSQELLDLTKLIDGLTTEQVSSGDYDEALERQLDLATELCLPLLDGEHIWDFREEYLFPAISEALN